MATGGVFTLITNDGKQDRMLMATELLKARLSRIANARQAEGLDPTPTLVDIEKTHVLFMNSHFKPFAAIGYEYNKVRASAGTVTLGSTVQFSLPQFGDFFHDMVLHVRLGAVTASTATQTWRWCAYPGERLLEKVRFTVNGNPLDEYYKEDYTFHRQFELAESKRIAYDRCAGQQSVMQGRIIPTAATSDAVINDVAATTAGFGTSVTAAAPGSAGFWVNVTDGYQTTKSATAHSATTESTGYQRTDILEVTMPLLFWFNKDPRLSIPSVSIPYGQRFIEIELAALTSLARGQSINADDATNDSTAATVSITGTEVPVCDLYVNNIFVNPEVHDIFIKRIGFNLIRVHRRQVNRITDATNQELLLNNFKWPIESIAFGFRDAVTGVNQVTASNENRYMDGWHRFAQSWDNVNGIAFGDTPTTAASAGTFHCQYQKLIPVVQWVTFSAHGIPIYNEIPAILYNQYIPLVFGDRVTAPDDPGCYLVTFCLYPGTYQPSGHINVSRAREFYVKFDDTVPANGRNLGTALSAADFIGSARAINFLLVSDGSAVLRYST